jgi:hypothetical protein
MLTRLAFFEGAIRLGWESQFEDSWNKAAAYLETDASCDACGRVARGRSGRRRFRFPMVLEITCPDRNATRSSIVGPFKNLELMESKADGQKRPALYCCSTASLRSADFMVLKDRENREYELIRLWSTSAGARI